MVFSSNLFLFVFLPLTLCGYFLIDSKYKNIFLMFASLFFYFWGEPRFIFIILTSILINYIFGLLINYANKEEISQCVKKSILTLGVLINLGILFYFKYYDFFIGLINQLFNTDITLKNIVLPIGISFFTFQGLSYIIDLYRDIVPVQNNPMKIALYISLFPQLIAGPIVRYKDVNEQINGRIITVDKFSEGINRFVIGLGKKAILANTIALIADGIFNLPYFENSVSTAWLGVISYTLQIYFDFSGYSDMAIGLGKMFGFDFLENFNYPYISKSITEFWRRWHISLSTFFKDYLYIPLGGNRKGNVYVNLIIVFFMTGLWHGASMNFIIWGLWHGIFMLLERSLRKFSLNKVIPSFFKRIYTLLVIMIGWVIFRANNIHYAIGYIGIMFGIIKPQNVGFSTKYYLDNFTVFIIILALIASTGLVPLYINRIKAKLNFNLLAAFYVAKSLYIGIILFICLIFIITSTYNPFIYFRF